MRPADCYQIFQSMSFQEAIQYRTELHKLAELSGQEIKTAQYITNKLEEMGFDVRTGVSSHGLIADIDSGIGAPALMLRADIDALPYADLNNPETIEAIHACGHDAHAAILLAAAPEIRNSLKKGKVRLAFQPAEESLQGALAMIKDGVLDGIDIVVGSHIRPVQDLPFGKYCSSVNHVACATVEVRIDGKQAHAARPHLGINPIEAASQYIASVGLLKVDPNKSWSVKPTQIHSEVGATNSIPSFVKIAYNLRSQDSASLEAIIERVNYLGLKAEACESL